MSGGTKLPYRAWSGAGSTQNIATWAEKNAGAKGNAPGFPLDYQYPWGAQTATNWEYIDARFDGGRSIPQIGPQQTWTTGEVQNMVPDVPFDYEAAKRQKENLIAYGLASLVVALILFQSR